MTIRLEKVNDTPIILCVDDDPNVLFMLRTQLLRYFPNCTIELAESGVEALKLVEDCRSQGIDIPLVIADQIMPGMKGDELLIQLHRRYPQMLKVMLTGQASAEDVGNVVNRGSLYRFIAKPWDQTDLILTVTEALRSYQQEKKLTRQQAALKQQQATLERQQVALEQANQELAALNADMERQVQERTQQLQHSEQQLRFFVEHVPAAVAMFDRNMHYLQVSERWKADYSLGDQEIIGRSHYEVFPDLPDRWQQIHQHCLAGVSQRADEDYFVRENGSVVWVQWEIHPWYTEANEIGGIILFSQVINARKQAEQALQESEANLKKAQEIAHLGNWEFHSTTGQVSWSEEVYRIHGLNFNQPILRGEEAKQHIHPDDHRKYQQEILEKVSAREGFACDLRIVHQDGSIRFIETRGEPFFDAHHQLLGFRGTVQDITDRKQAEIALAQEISRRKTLFDTSVDGIVILDDAGNIIEANASFARMLGYALEEITTLNLIDFDAHWTQEELEQKIDEQQLCSNTFETRHRRKDGSIYDVEISSNMLAWNDGWVHLCICRDITDRKQAEEALRMSEERWCLAIEGSNDGIWDHFLNNDEHYLSPRCLEIVGYPYEQVNTFEKWLSYVHPEDQSLVRTTLQAYLDHTVPIYACEYRMQCRDGQYKWLLARGKAIWNRNGTPIRILGSITDITLRRQTELALYQLNEELEERIKQRTQELARSEEDLRTIFNNVHDAILIHDMDGVFLDVNDRALELHHATREQLLAAAISDLCDPNTPIEYLNEVIRRVKAGEILCFEGKQRRFDDNSTFDVEISLKRITLGNRSVIIAGIRDISDRKHYEEQLQRTNEELLRATRLKDEFLATMSHELRTPLNAILGMSEALQEGILGPINEQQLKALKTIETSGSHLLELINDMLDVTKIESGQMELVCTSIAVVSLCQSSLSFIRQQALKKQIQLNLKLPSHPPVVYADERRIRQILINLLNNAVKFTPEGGQVTLEVSDCQPLMDLDETDSSAPSFLRITVRDTGIGIAKEYMHKLFQPFFQIDSALNRRYAGTGLGLALVKRIVELHGGQVGVTSEVGVGSCFTVDLPCITSLTLHSEQKPQSGSKMSHSQPTAPLILLVEDSEVNVSTTASYLTAKGYRLLLAHDRQEAIALAQAEYPDLILIDFQISGMNDLEIIQQIRHSPHLVKTPIIAITASATLDDRERYLAAGASNYLIKPIKLKQLATIIHTLLDAE